MPAILLDDQPSAADMEDTTKPEKKHKRSKSEKKRPREEDEAGTPRHHKKSKKHQDGQTPAADEELSHFKREGSVEVEVEPKKKSKKHRKSKDFTNGDDVKPEPSQEDEEPAKKSKKHKKHVEAETEAETEASQEAEEAPKKKKKDKSKKDKKADKDDEPADESQSKRKSKKKRKEKKAEPEAEDADMMDVDDAQPSTDVATSKPQDPSFPFYTQTISLYVPFYPIGFDKPITNVAAQHLEPLLNHYSPLLRGVLLAYRNVNLSERPVRPNPKHLPDDHTPALVESLDEYAVGFGWLTADVDLFIPSRGAWMEGTVNLQSEGHVGVVCWNKFNASIEAKRLPKGWRWVDLDENNDTTKPQGKHTFLTADPDTPEGTDILDDSPLELAELHTTGYWVNEAGERVSSTPLRFRIKNFDVGVAGDYGYISIEGTTLDDDEEREVGRQERELELRRKERQGAGGLVRPNLRRVPEFSLTSFGKEEQEEDSIKKTVIYQGSRPGTPDD